MKYPNHIILDFTFNTKNFWNRASLYWVNTYKNLKNLTFLNFMNLTNYDSLSQSLSSNSLQSLKIVNTFSFKIAHRYLRFLKQQHNNILAFSALFNLFNINFLRKEKIYTKLKYSRCPQYDMVSGGLAALFAGFLGFLIQEKFGLELLDSGDFYIAFMYGVFICFSIRPLLKILSVENPIYNVFSFKNIFVFFFNLFLLSIKSVNFFFSKYFFFSPFSLDLTLKWLHNDRRLQGISLLFTDPDYAQRVWKSFPRDANEPVPEIPYEELDADEKHQVDMYPIWLKRFEEWDRAYIRKLKKNLKKKP